MKFDLISDEYKKLLTDKHDKKSWGGGGKFWAPVVATLINDLNAGARILDYGCGRGTFRPAMSELRPDVEVLEYDPGVRGKDKVPTEPVEYVVCTDVLEHIEPDKIDGVLGHLEWLAKEGILLNIVFTASKSFLPDGRNTHILQKPEAWWMEKLETSFAAMRWGKVGKLSGRDQLVIAGKRDWGMIRDW